MKVCKLFLISPIVLFLGCAIIQGKDRTKFLDKEELKIDWAKWQRLKRSSIKPKMVFKPVELYNDDNKNERLQKFVTSLCNGLESRYNDGESVGQKLYQAYMHPKANKSEITRNHSRVRSIYGNTLLLCAVKSKKPKLIKYLLKMGVDKTLTDYDGNSPLDIARRESNVTYLAITRDYTEELSPEETFKKYCSNGKQIRRLGDSITATLFREENIPLDKALKILNKQKRAVRNEVKSLYARAFSSTEVDQVDRDCDVLNGTSILFSCKNSPIWSKAKVHYSKYAPEQISWRDFRVLSKNYVIKISMADQRRLFGDKNDPFYDYYKFSESCGTDRGYLGFIENAKEQEVQNVNCKFSPEKLLRSRERERLFHNFGYRFASISESPGNNSNELKFKVNLDLQLFCKNAIKVEDLLSR